VIHSCGLIDMWESENVKESLKINNRSINLTRFPVRWNYITSDNGVPSVVVAIFSELNGERWFQPWTKVQSPAWTPWTSHRKPRVRVSLLHLNLHKVTIPIFVFYFSCKIVWVRPFVDGKGYGVPEGACNPANPKHYYLTWIQKVTTNIYR